MVAIHRFSAGLRQDTVGVLIRMEMRYQEQGCEEGQPVLLDGQVCIAELFYFIDSLFSALL